MSDAEWELSMCLQNAILVATGSLGGGNSVEAGSSSGHQASQSDAAPAAKRARVSKDDAARMKSRSWALASE